MENFDIVKYLRENHLGSHAILGNYVDLHALKEEEVGNNSIDPATLSAIDSWVKKNYSTARTPNPAEVEDVEYYLGTDYIKLYKVEPNDPQQDDFDEDTTIAFINVTIEDGNIIYFEVRESIDYPGDYEQGEGYGEPTGVWDPKTNQFTREGNFSDDEDDEEFMEEDSKPKEKVALPKEGIFKDKGVAEKVARVYTTRGLKGVEVKKVGKEDANTWKIYVDPGQESMYEADYGNNQPVDKVPYGDGEGRLDGFGDEFDQVDPVEEMDNSMTGDKGWQYDDEDFFPERDKLDRMLGLSHEYIGKVSPIVRKTINSLRADGFDDQDIIDFLASDLS